MGLEGVASAGGMGLRALTLMPKTSLRCQYPDLVAFLKLRLLTNSYHLLRLLDLRGGHL